MLTYPEMENNTEWHELEAFVKPYEELFSSASTINLTADEEVSVVGIRDHDVIFSLVNGKKMGLVDIIAHLRMIIFASFTTISISS